MENESETMREVCTETKTFERVMSSIIDEYERMLAAKEEEISHLKAALKPVLECEIKESDWNGVWKDVYDSIRAVREAQRIYNDGGAT